MKFKLLLTAIIVLITALTLSAKPLIDSVGVKNNDGKKMVLFKVKAKDTYYSIGRRYHISPEALMKFNGSKKSALSIGAIVEIPTEIPFKKSAKEKESAEVPEKLSKKEKKEKAEREAKDEQEAAGKKGA
jgi:LysM repeat protein